MRYKIFLSLVTSCTILSAMEFRIGSGSFGWQMGMGFAACDFDLDTNVYSISEQHNNFGESQFYYFYNADLYQSDTVDKFTTLVTQPLTQELPGVGSVNDAIAQNTSIPVPAEYKIRGFDLNLGIGYDLLQHQNGALGIGINTGLSLPVMKMRNLQKSAQITYEILENTDTTILTYKLGPIVHALYRFNPKVTFFGSFSAGYQTGSIENDWIRSSLDVDGSYTTLDLNLRWTPWQSHKDLGWIRLDPKLFISIGYSKKTWDLDEVSVDAFEIAAFSSGGMLKSSFDQSAWYLGIGYDF